MPMYARVTMFVVRIGGQEGEGARDGRTIERKTRAERWRHMHARTRELHDDGGGAGQLDRTRSQDTLIMREIEMASEDTVEYARIHTHTNPTTHTHTIRKERV